MRFFAGDNTEQDLSLLQ